MFKPTSAFSGFTVDDATKAKEFYSKTLGLAVNEQPGGMKIQLPGGNSAWMYAKPDHQAGNHTMLNFVVGDIDQAVEALTKQGVTFERYDGMPQDEKGVMRGRAHQMGPDIAWFKDPASNILAVMQLAE